MNPAKLNGSFVPPLPLELLVHEIRKLEKVLGTPRGHQMSRRDLKLFLTLAGAVDDGSFALHDGGRKTKGRASHSDFELPSPANV